MFLEDFSKLLEKNDEHEQVIDRIQTTYNQLKLLNLIKRKHLFKKIFFCRVKVFSNYPKLIEYFEDDYTDLIDVKQLKNPNGLYYHVVIKVEETVKKMIIDREHFVTVSVIFPSSKNVSKSIKLNQLKDYEQVVVVNDENFALNNCQIIVQVSLTITMNVNNKKAITSHILFNEPLNVSYFFDFQNLTNLEGTKIEARVDILKKKNMRQIYMALIQNCLHQVDVIKKRKIIDDSFLDYTLDKERFSVCCFPADVELVVNLKDGFVKVASTNEELLRLIVTFLNEKVLS